MYKKSIIILFVFLGLFTVQCQHENSDQRLKRQIAEFTEEIKYEQTKGNKFLLEYYSFWEDGHAYFHTIETSGHIVKLYNKDKMLIFIKDFKDFSIKIFDLDDIIVRIKKYPYNWRK